MRPSRQGLLYFCQKLTAQILLLSVHLFFTILLTALLTASTACHAQDYPVSTNHDTVAADFVILQSKATRLNTHPNPPDQIVVVRNASRTELRHEDLTAFCFRDTLFETLKIADSNNKPSSTRPCRRLVEGLVSVYMCNGDDNTEPSTLYIEYNGKVETASTFAFPTVCLNRDVVPPDREFTQDELLAAVRALNRLLAPKVSY